MHLFEIHVDVYATEDDLTRLTGEFAQVLADLPHALSTVEASHDDLAEQWRLSHPGSDPGTRRAYRIRVGLRTSRERMEALREALVLVLCPEPEHDSPCPVPWASGFEDSEEELLPRYRELSR